MKKNIHEDTPITLKNHPWNGNIPNFIIILINKIVDNNPIFRGVKTMAIKNHKDAILWIKKYFILFSVS